MSGPFLVRIETSGNQAYIFATNRLRQNVGASELVLRACSQWVLKAVADIVPGRTLWHDSTKERVARLRDPRRNPPLGPGNPVEVVYATSGTALLLVDDPKVGRQIVASVTRQAVRDAPGLAVAGVVVPVDFGGNRSGIHRARREAGSELSITRGRLAAPESRFRQLPITAFCRTSGLPASVFAVPAGEEEPEEQSAVAQAKFAAWNLTHERIGHETCIHLRNHLVGTLTSLVNLEGWLAVIHADGNGVGGVLRRLAEGMAEQEDHVAALRDFSTGLELVALSAFDAALSEAVADVEKRRELGPDEEIPLVPLVLGGDDLTVVCHGALALPFTISYLRAFQRESVVELGWALPSAGNEVPPGLTAAAGVAFVKHHYPFHAAYQLAEGLSGSAKLAKLHATGRSSVDFHVHLGSTGAELASIRRERHSQGPQEDAIALWGGPYLVGVRRDEPGWTGAHSLGRLTGAIRLLRPEGEGRPALPSSAAHRLRASLAEGIAVADPELIRTLDRLEEPVARRLREQCFARPDEGSLSLVRPEQELWSDHPEAGKAPRWATAFVDAMDVMDLWAPGDEEGR
jgi:hypothetical protein